MSDVVPVWALDSSTFIHAVIVKHVWLLPEIRGPIVFSEYVFRYELGARAHVSTRIEAERFVKSGHAEVTNVTMADLERIASLEAPRRIGLGELTCAVLAEREEGGVLCDDWNARRWLSGRISIRSWETIEDLLILGADQFRIDEYGLEECQKRLQENKYQCRVPDLRLEWLRRQLNR